MRNKIFLLSILAFLALILSACGTAFAQEVSSDPARTINVTGTGEVILTPDIAYVSIGVRSEGEDAAKAVAENNAKSEAVIDALIDAGVDEILHLGLLADADDVHAIGFDDPVGHLEFILADG